MTAQNPENIDILENISHIDELKKFGIDIKGIEELAQPISLSRNELKKFKEEMDKLPETEKLAKTKEFLREKAKAFVFTENSTDKLKIDTKKTIEAAAQKAKTGVEGAKEAAKDLETKAQTIVSEKGAGEMIKGLLKDVFAGFGAIGKWFGDLFKNLLGMLGLGDKIEETAKDAATIAKEEAEKKAKEADAKIPEINKKQIEKVIYDKFSDTLKKQYNVNLDDKLADGKTTKAEKIKEILKNRLSGHYAEFIDPNKKTISFKMSDLYSFLGNGSGILFDLVQSGVIGIGNISFDLVTTAKGTVKYIVKSISGKDMGDLGLSGEIALDKIGDTNMSEQEKMFILAMFYRKGGFITEMLGHASWIMTSGVSALGQLGLEKAGAKTDVVGTATAMIPGVDKKIRKMEEIVARFEKIAPANSKELELMKSMIESSKNTIKALNVVKDFHEGKIKDLNVAKNMISEIKKSENIHWAKKIAMEGAGFDTWNKAYLKEIYVEKNQKYIELLEKSFDKGSIRSLAKLQSYFKFLEMPSSSNKSIMYFENEAALNKFAQGLAQTPEIAKRFFTHMPVFIVGGVMINESYKPNGDTVKSLSYLIPLYGPLRIMADSGISIDKTNWKVSIDNGADFTAGSILLTIDGYFFSKAILSSVVRRSIAPIGEFAIKPIVDIRKAGRAAIRFTGGTAKLATQMAIKLAGNLEKASDLKVKFAGRAVLAGIVGLVRVGVLEGNETPEEIKAKLEKEGILDKDGNPIITKIKANFAKLDSDKKKAVLDVIFSSNISGYYPEKAMEGFSTNYSGKNYVVKVKSKNEKDSLEKVMLASNLYNDFDEINNIKIEINS